MNTYKQRQINKLLASSGETLIRHGGDLIPGETLWTLAPWYDADPGFYLNRCRGIRLVVASVQGDEIMVIDDSAFDVGEEPEGSP